MKTRNTDRPPHVRPRLKQAPKLRDLYPCDLPRDAQLPELWKRWSAIVGGRSRNTTLWLA